MEGLERQNGFIEQTVKSAVWYGSNMPFALWLWYYVGESVKRAVDEHKANIVFETGRKLTDKWKV